MINYKPIINKALKKVCKNTFFYYPNNFKELPAISYYESVNMPYNNADDNEYLSEIVFVIDIWGDTSSEVSKICKGVNDEMVKIGFTREFSQDVYTKDAPVHKNMRYKLIV